MKNALAFAILLISLAGAQAGGKTNAKTSGSSDDMPPPVWITGEVFTKDDVLLFRLDKPVKGNPLKDVVFLGATTQCADTFLPMYMKAAEKHMTLRLYGWLLPCNEKIPGKNIPLPNVQFITWKIHLPGDPDVLPAKDRIMIPSKGN